MQNSIKNSAIYLSGGGDENQSLLLDKYFFNKIPKNGHFIYIPIALRDTELYSTAKYWMKTILTLHDRVDVQFDIIDDPSEIQSEDLVSSDAVYIGGGNTWSLMQELKDSGFTDLLVQYLKEGGQVYGGSAGAIILGKKIDIHDDENSVNFQDTTGLNLINNYSVVCHYKNEQRDRFKLWALQSNSPIICLFEESGLIVENDSFLSVGTKPCVMYQADGDRKEIGPGETFKL